MIEKTMFKRKNFFIAATSLQACALLYLAVPPMLTLTNGKTVTVQTEPVDPRDMFRGDYITLEYGFSDVPSSVEYKYDDKVLVRLKPDGDKQWKPIEISKNKLTPGADELVLRGIVTYTNTRRRMVRVRYGIEQVFVPEGRGQNLSSADKITIELAVPESGRAVIKRAQLKDDLLYRWRWL
jgi:uncharacterized membrane-anchored protein